ncbi:tRNA dihydrouridine(16) synthase DusC [Pseudomaricurvus alkylphenolicus]|uniref:tRNA-dihydrouridine synthase n=1 Tax=Pseudomaricurvus alkylphenolicus TaxID=1306991 RepID=UPI001420931D|nr:tRNA-dihydrouridine synthase [Pseudomaricurvus alkylphenolicus]NIB43031.1 tRNA dihydrouridine(16) synthase DusC [Pseudomaricurvus alkylphenolicus]
MRLFLAPMEGVVDHHVRAMLSAVGGIDVCVTEFVRVSCHQRLPERVFKRLCPELDSASRTPTGTEVRLQLLGGHPGSLAFNARKAAALGAAAIDLNFGCPAKTVNKNDGGASLLREPERLHAIVAAVREAVPVEVPVTAKIRLGFEDRSLYMDNALAACEAGANELVVHARSKTDGYKPPAYWDYIGRIREHIDIPLIANGEVWSWQDYLECRRQSGCDDVMLGRGLLAQPDLAREIKARLAGDEYLPLSWPQVAALLFDYYLITKDLYPSRFLGNRVKQWLAYMRLRYPEAGLMFEQIKRLTAASDLERAFSQHMAFAETA